MSTQAAASISAKNDYYSEFLFLFVETGSAAISSAIMTTMISGELLSRVILPEDKPSAYGGHTRIIGNSLQNASTVMKAVEFSQETMYCRVVDSFEFYLRSLVNHVLTVNPKLMANANRQVNSPEASMSYTDIVGFADATMEDFMAGVRSQFIRRMADKRKSYLALIKFIDALSSGKSKTLSDEEIGNLNSLFDLRNSITHENGLTGEEGLKGIEGIVGARTNPHLFFTDVEKVSTYLFEIGLKLEDVVKQGYWSQPPFIYSKSKMMRLFDSPKLFFEMLTQIHNEQRSPS